MTRLFAMLDTTSSTAAPLPEAAASSRASELPGCTVAEILPTVSFTFVCYFTIGILLASRHHIPPAT